MNPGESSQTSPMPLSHWKAISLLAVLAMLAYYNSLHGAFILDDHRFVSDPKINEPFAGSMAARPVVALTLSINYWLDGFHPRGYHLMNLLIHWVSAITLYDLVRRTLLLPRFAGEYVADAGWLAGICAAIWLVHPLQTQSVTYIIQRCESLMGMFYLLTFWCYLRYATATSYRWGWLAAGFLTAALGAGCKELLLTLPLLAWIYDRTFLSHSWRETIRNRGWALLLLSIPPFVGIAALIFSGFFSDSNGTVGLGVKIHTPWTYLLTQSEVITHYLRLSYFPVGLALDYLDWPVRRSILEVLPYLLLIGGLLVATLVGVILRYAWGFLGAWFFIILGPTSSMIPIQDAAFEHRMYLPLIAIVVLTVIALDMIVRPVSHKILGRPNQSLIKWLVLPTVIFLFAMLTVIRNEDYSSIITMYEANARERPNNPRVRNNLALQLFAAGKVEEAQEQLKIADQNPLRIPVLRQQRIAILREVEDYDQAIALAKEVLAENPGSVTAAYELGLSYLMNNQPELALPYLERLTNAEPDNVKAVFHYGIALFLTGNNDAGQAALEQAHRLDPTYAAKMLGFSRKIALTESRKPGAIRLTTWYALAALRMSPAPSPADYDTLSLCLARQGKTSLAVLIESLAIAEAYRTAPASAAMYERRREKYLNGKFELSPPMPKP